MKKHKIFLVEDDLNFGSVMKSYLEMNDYEVQWVNDGRGAIMAFNKNSYDLCILDVMLPHLNGFSVGADDYITKPFDSDVLIYKIKAILKRNQAPIADDIPDSIPIGKYGFDYRRRNLILVGHDEIKLSPKEAELLLFLVQNKNKVLDRNLALDKIWGQQGYFTARSMDVYVTKLRKYLKEDSSLEIVNIHGSGFMLKEALSN